MPPRDRLVPAVRLAAELEAAGVDRTTKQVKVNGKNLAGYRRADLEAAVPAELLLAARRVEATPTTPPATNSPGEPDAESA